MLLLILVVAAALRFVALDSSPPTLFRDEVEKGYNAWAILKDGAAYSVVPQGAYYSFARRPWPLFLNVYDSHTSMIYQYGSVPFVAALGLNAWGTRALAAVAGTLTVLLTFLLVREIGGRRAALWAAGLLAVSPWHVMFSRWAQQGILTPLFVTLGLWAFLRFLRDENVRSSDFSLAVDQHENESEPPSSGEVQTKNKPSTTQKCEIRTPASGLWLMLAAVAFAVAFYSYAAARVFVPLFLVWLAIVFWRPLLRRWQWIPTAAALFLLLSAPTINFLFSPESRARFDAVSGGASPLTFAGNWIAHYSPVYLFLNGDANLRHSFPGFGQLHLFEAGLWLAAIPPLWRLPRRMTLLLIGWLLIGPIPAALTTEGVPHALRSIALLPLPAILSGLGAAWLHERIHQRHQALAQANVRSGSVRLFRTALILGSVVLIIWFVFFARTVWRAYPQLSETQWGYPEREVFGPDVMPGLDEAPILVSPNLMYAPYFSLFYRQYHPGSLALDIAQKPGKPFEDIRGALFPTPQWNPRRDAPAQTYYWIGTPYDGLPGEVIRQIEWSTELAREQAAGAPALVVLRFWVQ